MVSFSKITTTIFNIVVVLYSFRMSINYVDMYAYSGDVIGLLLTFSYSAIISLILIKSFVEKSSYRYFADSLIILSFGLFGLTSQDIGFLIPSIYTLFTSIKYYHKCNETKISTENILIKNILFNMKGVENNTIHMSLITNYVDEVTIRELLDECLTLPDYKLDYKGDYSIIKIDFYNDSKDFIKNLKNKLRGS